MDNLLHYVWQYKLVATQFLQTTNHLAIDVLHPGVRNTSTGPDFLHAKIKIGDTLWMGHVLVQSACTSDSEEQVVIDDPSVILYITQFFVSSVSYASGQAVPQLLLTIPSMIQARAEELLSTSLRPSCYALLSDLEPLRIHSWLSSLLVERLEVKAKRILNLYESGLYHWSDLFFITLARNFGFGSNGEVFESWAKSLPYRALAKHRDSLCQVEAFFFGSAGFLEADGTDEYTQQLRQEYLFLSNKFGFRVHQYPWEYAKIRPGNFPNVRIAQLAWLYSQEEDILRKLLEIETLEGCYEFLYVETSTYWDTHYSFGKPSPLRAKQMGKKAKDLLIINTVVPFMYAYGLHKGDEQLQQKSLSFLGQLKSEHNYITRLWEQAGVFSDSAADSQGLIQLHRAYCEPKRCLSCRFGYLYLSQ